MKHATHSTLSGIAALGRARPRRHCRGAALVIVLSLLAVVTVIATSLAGIAHEETLLTQRHMETARSRYIAEASVRLVIAELLSPAVAATVPADGRLRTLDVEGETVIVSVRAARGLMDINSAGEEALRAVFSAAGADDRLATALAERVLDWRDGDDRKRASGAEDADYRALGSPWTARDGRFVSVDEVRYVLGMPPELFRRLSPYLTVHSGTADTDLAAAPPFLVDALGAGASGYLAPVRRPPQGGPGIFHINVGIPGAGGAFVSLEAVVLIGGGDSYSILEWREVSRLLTQTRGGALI